MRQRVILIFLSIVACASTHAQDIDQDKLIRQRDSLDNILMVNPNASAILVKKGELEFYSFNSLRSSTQFNDKQGNNSNLGGKYVLFYSLFQVNYGFSKNRRFNAGLDISYQAAHFDQSESAPLFSVFEGGSGTVRSLSYIGPRIRVQPFKRLYNFTYQTNFNVPVAKQVRQDDLNTSRLNWGHTFFYYRYFGRKIGLFAQANFTLAFPTKTTGEDAAIEFYLPLSVSVSYVPTKKDILFASLGYSWISLDTSHITEGADSDYGQYGLGYQRIITKRFFANISYNGTLFARNFGVWSGFNLGIRYLL